MSLKYTGAPPKASRVQSRVEDDLPGWNYDESTRSLTRTYHLPSFRAAIAFVDYVGEVAEALGHHPDVDVRHDRVTLRVTTHDAGGVTERDLELARRIDGKA